MLSTTLASPRAPDQASPASSSGASSHAGRTRGTSVQSRRAAHALGFSLHPTLPLSPPVLSPASEHPDHRARRASGSFFLPIDIPVSTARASRRPSLSNLSTFLAGIEHHTRVRTAGGRGQSRSVSRSTSRAGDRRGSFDGERILLDDDVDDYLSTSDRTDDESDVEDPHSPHSPRSRRGSIVFPTMGVPSFAAGRLSAVDDDYDRTFREEDELDLYGTTPSATGTLSSTLKGDTFFQPPHLTERHVFLPPPTPRMLPTSSGEEPYLETAPSSPTPFPLVTSDLHPPSAYFPPIAAAQRRYSSRYPDDLAPPNSLEDVDVFEEGERIGVGVWLENRGGWVRDCFGEEEAGLEIGVGGGGEGIEGAPTEMEVVRRLGEGTYAMSVLALDRGPSS